MSDGLWNSLSPNEFKQLQKYSEYSNYKLKDILEDLYGSEQEISHHLDMPINFEAFKAFMRMYFQEDIPEEFCKHLFLSFKSKNLQQPSKLEISSSVSQVKATFDVSRKPQHGESNTLVTSSLRDLNVPEESGQTTSLISRSKNKSKMFHAPAKSVSFAGSSIIHKTLILNNLEEIRTPTLTENSLLPQSSLDIASQFIYLKDIICYLSLLERGRAEDKLEFMFRLYDTEGNGYLDSTALEQIITQMVHVAEYLEWDTTELRPILKDMLEEIDLDQDGIVTLDEWIEGGMTTIPLLVLLGMETDESKDGMHSWRIKHFTRPAFCHLCRSVLVGVRKQALCCSFCKYTVHESCVFKQVPPCISTYTKSKRDDRVMYHVWMEDNRLVNCDFCKKAIKCYQPGSAVHCVWCHATVHKKCHFKMSVICDGDQLKDHLLLPTSIIPMVLLAERQLEERGKRGGQPGHSLQLSLLHLGPLSLKIVPPKDTHPLLVFVNPNSGTRQGDRVIRKFQYLLNPRQVYILDHDGPVSGLNFFRGVPNFRVLICGGDGTVSWVLDSLDKINFIEDPKVAILPLGTGNDLSRCLRWGSGYEGGSLTKVLKDIEQSSEVMLDRWQLDITPKGGEDVASYCTFNNYFSIGVDASIAHRFHLMREKYPQKFKSRLKNKLLYFECGTTETFASSCKRLHTFIEVECDGIILNLADTLLESIAVLNISSIYGGSNIWGENKNKSSHSGNKYPLTTQRKTVTDRKKLKSCIQDFSDRRVEVVGLEGTREMGQIYTGLKNAGKRLAQCTSVIIRTSKMLPMQVDGEPWLQGPCTLEITFKNQVHMLARLPPKPSFFFLKK
uniref:Diacylglycerol kinase n=1 Tax=Monodelphis domestica TaxID=13616 RepID=F7ED12_MONDO